jgi:hypothetical protein
MPYADFFIILYDSLPLPKVILPVLDLEKKQIEKIRECTSHPVQSPVKARERLELRQLFDLFLEDTLYHNNPQCFNLTTPIIIKMRAL